MSAPPPKPPTRKRTQREDEPASTSPPLTCSRCGTTASYICNDCTTDFILCVSCEATVHPTIGLHFLTDLLSQFVSLDSVRSARLAAGLAAGPAFRGPVQQDVSPDVTMGAGESSPTCGNCRVAQVRLSHFARPCTPPPLAGRFSNLICIIVGYIFFDKRAQNQTRFPLSRMTRCQARSRIAIDVFLHNFAQ